MEKPSSPIEANFPSHEKMMEVLTTTTNNCTFNQPFYHGQPPDVKWDEGRVNRVWYVGFYLTCESNTIIVVDHLAPYKKSLQFWIRPKLEDVQHVEVEQIIPIDVQGFWIEASSSEPVKFKIQNWEEVQRSFVRHFTD